MYKTHVACAGFAVAVCSITPAIAADQGGYIAPPQEPLETAYVGPTKSVWDGLYWGASLGYGFGESDHDYDRGANHGLAERDVEGGLASLTLGYNYRVAPQFVVGLEGDIGVADLSGDDRIIFDGHIWKTQFGPFWGTVRGRAGFLLGNTLIFGTGGWAFMDVDEVGIGDADGQTAQNRSFRSGYVVGGGVEHAFSPGVTAKVEYLHMDFGSYEGFSENQEAFSFDNRVDLVRTGLNFKF